MRLPAASSLMLMGVYLSSTQKCLVIDSVTPSLVLTPCGDCISDGITVVCNENASDVHERILDPTARLSHDIQPPIMVVDPMARNLGELVCHDRTIQEDDLYLAIRNGLFHYFLLSETMFSDA